MIVYCSSKLSSAFLLATALATSPKTISAQSNEAMAEIYSIASRVCGDFEFEGKTVDIRGSGELDSSLSALGDSLRLEGELDDSELSVRSFRGLLQEHLSAELKSVRDCRLVVFTTLHSETRKALGQKEAEFPEPSIFFDQRESFAESKQAQAFVLGYASLVLLRDTSQNKNSESNIKFFESMRDQLSIQNMPDPMSRKNVDLGTAAYTFTLEARTPIRNAAPELLPYFTAPLRIVLELVEGDNESAAGIARAINVPKQLELPPKKYVRNGDNSEVMGWFGDLANHFLREAL